MHKTIKIKFWMITLKSELGMGEKCFCAECLFSHEINLKLPRTGEAAAFPFSHSATMALSLNAAAGAGDDHDEVPDVPVQVNHGQLLGVLGPLQQAETGRRDGHHNVPDLAVIIW